MQNMSGYIPTPSARSILTLPGRDHEDAPVVPGRITLLFGHRNRAAQMIREDGGEDPDIKGAGPVARHRQILAFETAADSQRERS